MYLKCHRHMFAGNTLYVHPTVFVKAKMSAKNGSVLCALCKKEVQSTEIVVCGLWCQKFFHNKCVGLANIEARALKSKNKRVKFHCEACEERLGIELFGGKETEGNCVNNSINILEHVQNLLKLTSDLSNNSSELNKKLDRILTSNGRLEEYILQSPRRFAERNEEQLTDCQKQNDPEGCISNRLQEWEVSDSHNSVTDPLSINEEECSPSEEFPFSFTNSIAKTQAIKDEDIAESNDYREELKQEMEFTNSDNGPERITQAAETHSSIECSTTQEMSHRRQRCGIRKKSKKTPDLKQTKHTGEVSYSCSLCNKTFSRRARLKQHLVLHTGEQSYSSDVCYKTFTHSNYFKQDDRLHTCERPYGCNICNMKLKNSNNLKYRPYSCDMCKKTFINKSNLDRHFRVHTGERPYSCYVCNKKFNQSNTLKDHIRIHTGERPYCCHICNKRFAQRKNLINHKKQHTGDVPTPE